MLKVMILYKGLGRLSFRKLLLKFFCINLVFCFLFMNLVEFLWIKFIWFIFCRICLAILLVFFFCNLMIRLIFFLSLLMISCVLKSVRVKKLRVNSINVMLMMEC